LGRESSVLAYWSDGRWFEGYEDLYAQLLTRHGQVAAGWSDTGLMVARAARGQRPSAGLSHPDGSFIVGFGDGRNAVPGGTLIDSYISRILPDGRIDPAWPRHGFRAIGRPNVESPYRMTWVAPETLMIASRYQHPVDINIHYLPLLQRVAVTPAGPELPWGIEGILHDWRPLGLSSTLELTPDGEGGAYVLFDEFSWTSDWYPSDISLMRVGRDGQPAPGWGPDPVGVATAPGIQEMGAMCADGAGGVYVAWADARDGAHELSPGYIEYQDIRLQRITPQGQVHPGWPADGLVVSGAPGWQAWPALLPDGTGGVYVAFDDVTIGLTRVQGDGTFAPGWAQDGIQISSLFAFASHSRMAADGIGGVYVLFEDVGRNDLYLQRVLPWGVVDPAWPTTGYLASVVADGDIVSDGEGGCYVTSTRPSIPGQISNSLVFVTRYSPDGVVPVKLADATIEAEPGRVRLEWHGVEVFASDLTVQRRPEGIESWTSVGTAVIRGSDVVEYVDTTVEPGDRYAYRLTRGAEILSEEEWVTVPANAVFALTGARPNPARAHEASVEFTLAGAGTARLEVLDLAGRRVYERELTNLEPGRQVLSLSEARLAPGVHWLRLSEGARSAHTRIVVVK
jgi:hypothetical protein